MDTPPSLDSLGSVPQARHPPDPEQLPTPAGACAGRPELPDLPGLAFPAGYRTAKLPIEMDILVSIRQLHPRLASQNSLAPISPSRRWSPGRIVHRPTEVDWSIQPILTPNEVPRLSRLASSCISSPREPA